MKEKKQSPSWNIAATHWLTSYISANVLLIVLTFLLVSFVNTIPEQAEGIPFQLVSTIVYLILLWFTIQYSAKYINKRYVISDAKLIANLATLYVLIIGGVLQVLAFSNAGFSVAFFVGLLSFLVTTFIFYLASKKFISQYQSTSPTSMQGEAL